jgi:hypothetical protein
MKTYSILFAQDIAHYGQAEIEAKSDEAAIRAAQKPKLLNGICFSDIDWENAILTRIVFIQDSDGNIIAENIALDQYHLRHGGDADQLLCEAAADMLAALEAQEMAEHDPEAARRKGYFDIARDLRKAAIAKARGTT